MPNNCGREGGKFLINIRYSKFVVPFKTVPTTFVMIQSEFYENVTA
jgi:hypothetical protein